VHLFESIAELLSGANFLPPQGKRKQRIARSNGNVLRPVHRVAHRAAADVATERGIP
jgi:hypothetical protein